VSTRQELNGEVEVRPGWHGSEVSAVARELGVEPERGLSVEEARNRLRSHGPNRLTGAKKESGFQAFVRQYRDFMQIILLAAAAINLVVTGDVGTSVVLAGLTVFNAVIGLRQEAKAEESVKALAQMMKTVARVRRDGQAIEIDAEELVPGDVVLMEAGNRVPADGRICVAATLEIEEAALTGESLPVGKATEPVPGAEVALGDRICMAYMNTSVTRGRGEMVVTATGMGTEIGHIADLLAKTEADKTPLQKQLDDLSKIIATIAGIALLLVIALGLARGESFDTLFITGVALAVAAIPTGLPAVVTALLSIGTREIARRNAIVKRLPAVETLGSTSVICSDKTGTLTLNKMTARELAIPGQHRFTVSGEGYSTDGEIKHVGGSHIDLDPYLLPMILCADAVLDGENLIGDPTEGALIVLAAKGGLDISETRSSYPRIAEVPFDSDYKFMATFHQMTGAGGEQVVRVDRHDAVRQQPCSAGKGGDRQHGLAPAGPAEQQCGLARAPDDGAVQVDVAVERGGAEGREQLPVALPRSRPAGNGDERLARPGPVVALRDHLDGDLGGARLGPEGPVHRRPVVQQAYAGGDDLDPDPEDLEHRPYGLVGVGHQACTGLRLGRGHGSVSVSRAAARRRAITSRQPSLASSS